jgi:hypothetical protein
MINICEELHFAFFRLKRFYFPFEVSQIPPNGIYILFERGERAHGEDRIVRIGTHTGENQLCSRLKQHFEIENKDRSIFRKNIGRALLNQNKDPFLKQWNWDLTTRKNKEIYGSLVDLGKLKRIEREVSRYIQKSFSFVVFAVLQKEKRLSFESKIISTVSQCAECSPSISWLGLSSPNPKIRNSGLWQVNEIYKRSLLETELIEIKQFLR